MTLQGLAEAFGLHPLALENPIAEILRGRRTRGLGHEVMHHVPSVKAWFQPIHAAALPELKGFIYECVDACLLEGVFGRQALQPVFTCKATAVAAVVAEIFQPKPHLPSMLVATTSVKGRRSGEVKRIRFLRHDLGQDLVKHRVMRFCKTHAVWPVHVVHVLPTPRLPCPLHLVVAAPKRERRVMGQPPNLFFGLPPDVVREFLIVGDHGAGKHEVLPDEQTMFIAGIEERVRGVYATAPNADHVHVGVSRLLGERLPALGILGLVKVWRDHIGATGLNRHAVDLQLKGRSPTVRVLDPRERSHSQNMMVRSA